MSDISEPDNSESNESSNPNLERLRQKAARADELEAQLRERDRKDAFAGLNIESGPGKMLADMYQPGEGESFSREGVAKLAETYGIKLEDLSTSPPPPQQEAPPTQGQEPVAQNQQSPFAGSDGQHFETQTQAVSGGEEAGATPDVATANPVTLVNDAFQGAKRDGAPTTQAQVAGVGAIFQAAAAGNPDVIYDQERWREQRS